MPVLTAWANIPDPEPDDIAAARLAVDREVEEGQVARPALSLQLRADRSRMVGAKRWLRSDELANVPGFPGANSGEI